MVTLGCWEMEMEEIMSKKVFKEWEAIERMCYDEDDLLPDKTSYTECIQWKTQIPHLRILGKPLSLQQVQDIKNCDNPSTEKIENLIGYQKRNSFSQEASDFSKRQLHKTICKEVLHDLLVYVNTQLFPLERSHRQFIEDVSRYSNFSGISDNNNIISKRNNEANHVEIERLKLPETQDDFTTPSSATDQDYMLLKNDTSKQKKSKKMANQSPFLSHERLYTPQVGRNKLGTVFNERIIVSPVPYVVSTKESFSTLRTTPIKITEQPIEIVRSRVRNVTSAFDANAWKPDIARMSHIRSAWQAPVRPTIWPKNLRLAPLNTSRLPNDFNRSLAPSPQLLQRNKKPLSPISRSVTPSAAFMTHYKNDERSTNREKHTERQRVLSPLTFDRNFSGNSTQSTKRSAEGRN